MVSAQAQNLPTRRGGRPLGPWIVIPAILFVGAVLETLGFTSRVYSARAAAALNRREPGQALELSRDAQALWPYNERAGFTRCMALRTVLRPEIADYAEALACWHPQRGVLLLMAGEARLNQKQPALALNDLWSGLWCAPIPGQSPAIFWRDAWQAALQTADPSAPKARAARGMTEALVDHDPYLDPAARQALKTELNTAVK